MLRSFISISLLLPLLSWADQPPTVEDLAWMTGSWDGSGNNVLEENWGLPRAGTLVSLVRSTSAEGTSMVEIVHIEEANNTLELYLQQWNVPFNPRSEQAQKMTLSAMGDHSVSFEAVSPGGLKTLKYSRHIGNPDNRDDDEFHVDVTLAEGQNFVIKLTPQLRP